jgi:hypothetical protein
MRGPKRTPISVSITPALKSELEAEAWEEQRTLSQYVAGLLERRGKWARSRGTAGGYDLQAELPASKIGGDV